MGGGDHNIAHCGCYTKSFFAPNIDFILYLIVKYLTRHIYMDHNSGDRNFGSTKIWGFFSEIPKFRTPN